MTNATTEVDVPADERASGGPPIDLHDLSDGERCELQALGMLSDDGRLRSAEAVAPKREHAPVEIEAVSVPTVLNEAYEYEKPSSFSRATSVEFGGVKLLFISGTASVGEGGDTVHKEDFRAQCWRTYRNITEILRAEGMTWEDVGRATCYLRDIERDYDEFNEVRTAFFRWLGLDPLPASTGIQARLCRDDLLVEMEAIAVAQRDGGDGR